MSNKLKLLWILCVLASTGTAYAIDTSTGSAGHDATGSEDSAPAYEVGSQARQWLDMQREGTHASPQAQTLPGPVMDQVYQRYIRSFGHPIPDLYEERAIGQQ